MDIKELGAGGFIIIGGAVFGLTQMGLNDVLSEDLKHISEISQAERPDYMDTITAEFAENFGAYSVDTGTYVYAGLSRFSSEPSRGRFVELVTQDTAVPKNEIKKLHAQLEAKTFCEQDEMTMFTNQGWSYKFTLKDSTGRKIADIHCEANTNNNVA